MTDVCWLWIHPRPTVFRGNSRGTSLTSGCRCRSHASRRRPRLPRSTFWDGYSPPVLLYVLQYPYFILLQWSSISLYFWILSFCRSPFVAKESCSSHNKMSHEKYTITDLLFCLINDLLVNRNDQEIIIILLATARFLACRYSRVKACCVSEINQICWKSYQDTARPGCKCSVENNPWTEPNVLLI